MKTSMLAAVAALSTTLSALPAHAVEDPAGDLLPSFTGAPVAALDILESHASFDSASNSFTVSATTAGAISGASGVAYAFGFDKGGASNAAFAAIGFPDVKFNAVVSLRADGTGNVGSATITPVISGNTISATFSAALLPSTGLAFNAYTWALWSQDLAVSGLARNADFGPTANLQVSSVPESASWALMAAGLGLLAWRRRLG
jgi:hypothetical protein